MPASLKTWIKTFCAAEDGVTAIEYGLIAALICVVIISAVTAVSTQVGVTFDTWSTAVHNAVSGT
jgi:pilus assembly protein Flp/PilA